MNKFFLVGLLIVLAGLSGLVMAVSMDKFIQVTAALAFCLFIFASILILRNKK